MIAAAFPVQRPTDAKLLVVDRRGRLMHLPRSAFTTLVNAGDLLVANDASTVPASLSGVHLRTGLAVEVRLAGRCRLAPIAATEFIAVVFGDGDFRTPTERRPPPPPFEPGDRLQLGPLEADVVGLLDHPRLVLVRFVGTARDLWRGLALHGRPIQYAHMTMPLEVWDTWTSIAGPPVAFEPPSATFLLDWALVAALRQRGVSFATITHAAGISSTGDAALDARLPLDEPYLIPADTAARMAETRARGGRVIAVGTTVVRALEHAARPDGTVSAGEGLATQRVGADTTLGVVDALVSGTHEPGTSHHELLRAFVDVETLRRIDEALDAVGYRTHEFGDSVFVERMGPAAARDQCPDRRTEQRGQNRVGAVA